MVKLFKKRVIFMSAYQMISYMIICYILYRSSCRFTNILATCFAVFYCYLYHNVFVFMGDIYFSLHGFILPSIGVLNEVLHTIKDIFSMFPGRFLFFLFCGCYSVVLV